MQIDNIARYTPDITLVIGAGVLCYILRPFFFGPIHVVTCEAVVMKEICSTFRNDYKSKRNRKRLKKREFCN